MDGAIVRELSEKLIRFLETGDVPEGLFRPDVFLDLTMPTWRVQAASAEDLIAERKQGHPGPGRVTRWRADAIRVRPRVRGTVEQRGATVVRTGDDADRGGRGHDSRGHRLLHR
jgi:hypothetical protein